MYEIPQQLEYKEKIIFGLTFTQLIYAMIFFPIIFIIIFRVHASLATRITIALFPFLLACGFIFLNLSFHLKNWIIWFKSREIKTKEKMERWFYIKEIKNNLIVTKNKKLAVLKVEPINFSIKPQGEQEALILAFQKFLNSLDFPIQLLMTTETLNLEEYLNNLRHNIDESKVKVFEEYEEHIKKVIKDNSAMNRRFYLIIPETSNIEIQVKICEDRLNGLNLKTSRLNDQELTNIVKKMFDTSEHLLPEKINNYLDYLKIDNSVKKEEEKKPKEKKKKPKIKFKDLLKKLKEFWDKIRHPPKKEEKKEEPANLNRVIFAHGYPRIVDAGFLDRIVSCPGNFDLSMHMEPYPLESTIVSINRELQKQRADLYSAKLKGQLNPSLEIKYQDTQKTLENLQKGKEKLFNISFYVNCKAEYKAELELLTKRIESELNALLIIPKQASFRMIQGFKSCLPLAENVLGMKRNVTTPPLSAFFPFTSSFFKYDNTGVWFGLNRNKIPIIRDIFKLSNANGICLATSGSGKSYMAKLFISRYLLNGTKVMVIDPQGEYSNLVKMFDGQRIDLSRKSKTMINPLDLMGHDYLEKRLALMDLMPIMLGDLTEPQKSFIDRALTKAYKKKGIRMEDERSWNNEPPILGDVLEALENMERKAITLERTTIRSLMNRLDIYVNGVFSFINKQTKINFDNRFVCFDIGNLPRQVKPVIMFLVLDYVYMKMKRDLERKLLVIDEAWALLSRTEDASYIFEIVKTCRKFNLGLFLINQEVEGMLESEAGRSVLANTSYTLLLRQKPAVIDDIQKTFHLSNAEKVNLLTANVGEGLLLMEDEHSEIKIVASELEHKQITTNADEILANNNTQDTKKQEQSKPIQQPTAEKASQKPAVKVVISVDADKRFYRHKDLKLDDIKYLLAEGYKQYKFKSIAGNKKEFYLLKQDYNESPQHFFLIKDIESYIRKFTDKVQTFNTGKPDIVFEVENQKYAIEIETGKVIKDKKKFSEKIRLLKKNYGQNWFFVVTDWNLQKKYAKFGETYTKLTILNKLSRLLKNV